MTTVTPQPPRPSKAIAALAAWSNARQLMRDCLDGKPVKGGRILTPEEAASMPYKPR